MPDLDATTIAAWWGAIIATIVLVWDIWKWKAHARLKLEVLPNRGILDATGRTAQGIRTPPLIRH